MIKFDNVSMSFGRKTPIKDGRKKVLKGVNFHLPKGDIICLLGPSGCGKSTMVNLIIGNLIPTEGSVTVMDEKAPYKNARSKTGFMPQENALYEDITAKENLEFFGALNGLDRKTIKERIPKMLELVRLKDEANSMVCNFSGGMKRRLSLAITLLHDPQLIILDEPTVGLDPDHRKRIWDNFDALAADGKTLLVTTHVMDEAERCNRIAMLYDGKIIATGSPDEILRKTGASKLEEAFLILENEADFKEASAHE